MTSGADVTNGAGLVLSERELEDLSSGVAAVVSQFDDAYWTECDATSRYPAEYVSAMAEGGWLGLSLPPQYGGGGLGMEAGAVVLRTIAESGAGLNGCIPVHMTMFATAPIVEYGSEELKAAVLPQVVEGTRTLCFMVSEPDAGSDTSRTATRAVPSDSGWMLTGEKTWITQALEADSAVVLARTSPASEGDRFGGLTMFLSDLDPKSVDIKPIAKLPHNALRSCSVFLTDLPVAADRVIGQVDRGFSQILIGLNSERVLMAAEMIGIGYAALRAGVSYAKERNVFGRPIGQNQAISQPLARADALLAGAWLAVREAARELDRGVAAGASANRAKYLASEACWAACDTAVQVFGGMGMAKESHVERYFREARLLRIAPVSQEMALNYISSKVLGLPRSY